MKKIKNLVGLAVWVSVVFWAGPVAAQFPTHLAGFTLGEDISLYNDTVRMSTCREMARMPYLSEGEMVPSKGIKSGLVTYGLCHRPQKILRIKLKFEDESRGFYNTLLEQYTRRFGPPGEYKGDAFQTVIAWKWSFVDRDKERVSLIIQHNKLVDDEKKGNSVKMTLTTQMERERACYKKARAKKKAKGVRDRASEQEMSREKMWKMFIPY